MIKDQFGGISERLMIHLATHENFRRAFAAIDSSVANHQCESIIAAFLRQDFWLQREREQKEDPSANFLNDPANLARFLTEH